VGGGEDFPDGNPGLRQAADDSRVDTLAPYAVMVGDTLTMLFRTVATTSNQYPHSVTLESFLFYFLAIISVGSALMMVTRRNAVIAALYLILNFFALGGLYLTLHAQFIAFIQILVYAGAIMVLFLFVIMLLNLGDVTRLGEKISYSKIIAAGLSFGLLMELIYVLGYARVNMPAAHFEKSVDIGTVENIGRELFTTFLFPFEVTSILLLAAIVGAVILAKKKLI
jgi:NADH-quinone oxidoreductase subunit J